MVEDRLSHEEVQLGFQELIGFPRLLQVGLILLLDVAQQLFVLLNLFRIENHVLLRFIFELIDLIEHALLFLHALLPTSLSLLT